MTTRNEVVKNYTNSKFNRKLVVKLFDKFPLLTVTSTAKSDNENNVSADSEKR